MATMFDISFLQNNFLYIEVFNQNWIVPLMLTFLFTICITRRPNQWPTVFLPMAIGLRSVGLYFSVPIYTATVTLGGILFIVSALGSDVIGGTLRTVVSTQTKEIQEQFDTKAGKRKFIKDMALQTAYDKAVSKHRGDIDPSAVASLMSQKGYSPNRLYKDISGQSPTGFISLNSAEMGVANPFSKKGKGDFLQQDGFIPVGDMEFDRKPTIKERITKKVGVSPKGRQKGYPLVTDIPRIVERTKLKKILKKKKLPMTDFVAPVPYEGSYIDDSKKLIKKHKGRKLDELTDEYLWWG